MTDTLLPLVLDLVEWVEKRPRPYVEVMEAWRTSCPRLPVWEEAIEQGYLIHDEHSGRRGLVTATARGRALLAEHGRMPKPEQDRTVSTGSRAGQSQRSAARR